MGKTEKKKRWIKQKKLATEKKTIIQEIEKKRGRKREHLAIAQCGKSCEREDISNSSGKMTFESLDLGVECTFMAPLSDEWGE